MIVVLIIDEFDTVQDQTVRQSIAETIKFFSDRSVPGTVILIGVADDVESLVAEHRSIERCVAQIRMRRMSRDEIESIVTNSLEKVGMTIEREGLHEISRIAIGLPHYAHFAWPPFGGAMCSIVVRRRLRNNTSRKLLGSRRPRHK